MREIQISRFRHKKTKCTNLCLFVKNVEIEKRGVFNLSTLKTTKKVEKVGFPTKLSTLST